jgi:transcription initiation factor TFIIIB Brf1 subunit/transcription initiation factor TFIIB
MTVEDWTGEAGDCSECGGEDTVAEHIDGTRVCAWCDTVLAGDLDAARDGD